MTGHVVVGTFMVLGVLCWLSGVFWSYVAVFRKPPAGRAEKWYGRSLAGCLLCWLTAVLVGLATGALPGAP